VLEFSTFQILDFIGTALYISNFTIFQKL